MLNHIRALFQPAVLIISCSFTCAVAQNPSARPNAVITTGNVRFSILTPQLIRLEWSRDTIFQDKASLLFIDRNLPAPKYTTAEEGDWLKIKTEKLTLRYRKNSGKFTPGNLFIDFILNGKSITWHPGLQDSLNLKGTTRTLDGTNGEKDVSLEQGILSRGGWALIDDSQRQLYDGSDWNWVNPRPDGEMQDWYFFGYGHDYKNALYDFTRVAGRIPMPPKFAFGYWWSRYWTYSDRELRDLVADMRRYDVPIDILIIDMDWHETYGLSVHGTKRDPFGQSVGWTGYTWNKSLFPDPERFLKWKGEQSIKTALNLHPASGISPMEEKYKEFARNSGFDTAGAKYIPFEIENKKWAKTYFDDIIHPLEKQGIDFWWLDWQAWLENKNLKGLSNTWWLNYVFFTDMERQGKQRPLLFHRWGGLGNHRYQIGFSGDSWSTWEALAYQPYFTATAGNVGYGYWSHDIGGHVGNDPDPELYLRWIQWGIFSPILRTHSTKSSTIERRIWKYPEHFEMMRDAFHLRYELVPYIYTAARKAYDKGISICRPMYYDYPESGEAYDMKGQYMFGDDMIVAPISKKASKSTGLSSQRVWLPEGDWYELFTGTLLKGGSTLERTYALNEIPVFVKAGSIIPLNPKVSNLQQRIDTLALTFIPGGNGETNVYEDDGKTSGYKNNQFSNTKITKEISKDSGLTVTIYPREGLYQNMPLSRAYELRIPGSYPPTGVMVTGKSYPHAPAEIRPGTWTYNGPQLTTVILTPMIGCDKKTQISITYSGLHKGNRENIDGMRALFGRLPGIVQMMKDEVNRRDQIANAPPLVLKLGSLPTMIEYEPQKAFEYLQQFHSNYNELLKQVMNYPRGDINVLETIVNQFPFATMIAQKPAIKLEKAVSEGPMKAEITAADNGAIRYTLDGTEPDGSSPLYTGPLLLAKTATIKAKTFSAGCLESFTATENFQLVFAKSVQYAFPNSQRYTGGGDFALLDGKFGKPEDFRNGWVGFQKADFTATIELLKPRSISSITARFLQDQESWIFLPASIVYEVSTDGVNYQTVFREDTKTQAVTKSDERIVRSYTGKTSSSNITHIRVRAKNVGVCPAWHVGSGGSAWLFVDEIVVE